MPGFEHGGAQPSLDLSARRHYLPELAELGATIAVARAGRVAARGSQAELSLDGLFPAEPRDADDTA